MAFSSNALHAAPIFRALHGLRGAWHAPRNDSDHAECGRVYYTTLSIVFCGPLSGRGHAYWIFIFWTGNFEFRLTSNISAAEQGISKKFQVEKFTIEFYTPVEFAPDLVRRSNARGPKRKTFPPKFLENRKADRHYSGTVRYRSPHGRKFWNMPHLPPRGWGWGASKFDQKFCKIGSNDFR